MRFNFKYRKITMVRSNRSLRQDGGMRYSTLCHNGNRITVIRSGRTCMVVAR
jgi:hypothetical protein